MTNLSREGRDSSEDAQLQADTDEDTWGELAVKRLILEADNFIVFIDKNGDIDWRTNKYDWSKTDLGKFNAVINRAAALETIKRDGIDALFISNHKRLVAEAIARALDGDLTAAQAMLDLAEGILNARSREESRLWYLSAACLTVVPFLVMTALIWSFRSFFLAHIGNRGGQWRSWRIFVDINSQWRN
ncbi:MAG: hypothetical protein AB1508_05505 [Pseudomonadota bacterium]